MDGALVAPSELLGLHPAACQENTIATGGKPFRPQFRTGEDQDFFTRMIELGYRFIWCDEATAYEVVPPKRWKRSFMVRRALLRGKVALNHHSGMQDFVKSLIAVIGYTLSLPIMLVLGHHCLMKCIIRICDHAGKLLAFIGLNPIREKYVLE